MNRVKQLASHGGGVSLVDDGGFGDIAREVQRTLAADAKIRFLQVYTYPCT